MAYRPEWFPTNVSVLDMALQLHMVASGASDPSKESDALYLQALRHCLNNWVTYSNPNSMVFDAYVQGIVKQAVKEYDRHLKETTVPSLMDLVSFINKYKHKFRITEISAYDPDGCEVLEGGKYGMRAVYDKHTDCIEIQVGSKYVN